MSSKPSTPSDPSSDAVLTVPASLDQLRFITAFVAQHAGKAGFSPEQIHRIELAVDEACSNIIIHAYNRKPDGNIAVRISAVPGSRIVITLIDTGKTFDPDGVPPHDPATGLDNLKVGGLGLFLMRQTMDDVQFEFDVAGNSPNEPARFNRLTMVKHV
jgi:serine/threonine-protein kinase RsbW